MNFFVIVFVFCFFLGGLFGQAKRGTWAAAAAYAIYLSGFWTVAGEIYLCFTVRGVQAEGAGKLVLLLLPIVTLGALPVVATIATLAIGAFEKTGDKPAELETLSPVAQRILKGDPQYVRRETRGLIAQDWRTFARRSV